MATEERSPTPSVVPTKYYSYKVGYAMKPSKVSSLIQPSLVNHAQQHGIHLIPIQLHKSLLEQQQDQAPFDVILHKLYGARQLDDYKSHHPDVIIIDSPAAIQRLHHRISMLDSIPHLPPFPSHSHSLSFGIPTQLVINNFKLNPEEYHSISSLKFPVIAKPLLADGTTDSHQMCLVFNSTALHKLNPSGPIVLQEFVNHGGFLFKVYVAGDHVSCVKRASLPDIIHSNFQSQNHVDAIMSFSQVSNLAAPTTTNQQQQEKQQMPPLDFVTHIAQHLRQALNLHLFNFDIIRDYSTMPTSYLIIDINYFPGYEKLPAFETIFTQFLLDIFKSKAPAAQ